MPACLPAHEGGGRTDRQAHPDASLWPLSLSLSRSLSLPRSLSLSVPGPLTRPGGPLYNLEVRGSPPPAPCLCPLCLPLPS